MSKNDGALSVAGIVFLGMAAATGLLAQYAAAPASYSATVVNGMLGGPIAMQIYRDGSKAVIDHPAQHSRSLYDLQAHTNYSWDLQHPENGCSAGNFSGDWGDPFDTSDVDELLKSATGPPTSETVDGFAAKAIEATDPKSKIKVRVWRESKYGLVVKADMTPPGGATSTIVEVKQFSAMKPAAGLFVLPAGCGKPAPPTPAPAERFAAEIGDIPANLVDATTGPGSPNSCAMLVRFVAAGSMQPLTNFQVALDLDVDFSHPASYVMGGSPSGRSTFSGGHLKEYTAQIQNGVLRVPSVPDHFDMELTFAGGNAGASSALLYRKCAGPQTVLLYVARNPGKTSDGGDWMWVKSGKFATVPTR